MTSIKAHTFLLYARRFFFGTALSRVLGMFRDMSMALIFGSSPQIAVFMLAYRFIYLFRRLLGESTLQASFIPFFEGYRMEDPKRGALFFRDCFWSLTFLLLGIVCALEVGFSFFSHPIMHHIRWMLPGVIFIVLFALSTSHLFCEESYIRPSLAPACFNLIWIISLWVLPHKDQTFWLSIALVCAFFLQWYVVGKKSLTKVFRILRTDFYRPQIFSSDVKKMIKPVSFVFFGVAATQLNSMIDGFFAYFANASGPAFLWYAIRWQQLPISLIAVSLSGATLPTLTRALQNQQEPLAKEIFKKSFQTATFLTLFAFFGILSFGGAGLNFVYGRGAFTSFDVVVTLKCLWAYLIGLIPMTALILLTARSQAEKNYLLPMKASFVCVICNILLNTIFVFGFAMKAESVALATSLSACIQCLFYIRWLKSAIDPTWILSTIKLFCSCICSMGITLYLGNLLFKDPTLNIFQTGQGEFVRGTLNQLITVFFMVLVYVFSFAGCAYILKIREFYSLFRKNLVRMS